MTASHKVTVTRVGYRGRALTLIGVVWGLVGLSVALTPFRNPDNLLVIELLPTWFRVSLWTAAFLVAVITAWWPPGADRYGFMALVVPAAMRCGAYAWDALMGFVTGNEIGHSGEWVSAVAWGVIVAFVLLVASWPEPGEIRPGRSTS